MGDGPQARLAKGDDPRRIDPEEWFVAHEQPFVEVFGGRVAHAPLGPRFREAVHRLEQASRLAEVPRRQRRDWHKMSPYLMALIRPNESIRHALDEMFGPGCPLWRAAQFLRRLWHKWRDACGRARRTVQHYANRPFWAPYGPRNRGPRVCYC